MEHSDAITYLDDRVNTVRRVDDGMKYFDKLFAGIQPASPGNEGDMGFLRTVV